MEVRRPSRACQGSVNPKWRTNRKDEKKKREERFDHTKVRETIKGDRQDEGIWNILF